MCRTNTLEMTVKDREKASVMRQLSEGRLRVGEAAEKLGMCRQQVSRILARWTKEGDGAVISRNRGREAPNRLDPQVRARIEALLRSDRYRGFGGTLASEKFGALEGIKVSKETLRSILVEMGEHRPKRRRKGKTHVLRERRPRFGELIQLDGSPHDWFEGRGGSGKCTLIILIDDATSIVTAAFFAPTETIAAYAAAVRAHILRYGVPVALYSDKSGIFRVNAKDAVSGDGKTEFNRISARLGMEHICAHSPEAKGRVERSYKTLQDRLVKEMRLQGISDIETANAWLPTFFDTEWKDRFSVAPLSGEDAHRPWTKTEHELDRAFAEHMTRELKNHRFRYDGKEWRIDVPVANISLKSVKVGLRVFKDGRMEVEYNGRLLPHSLVGAVVKTTPEADAKTLNHTVDQAVQRRQASQSEAVVALAA